MDDCGTSAAKAAPICGSYVVAKARTRKDDERGTAKQDAARKAAALHLNPKPRPCGVLVRRDAAGGRKREQAPALHRIVARLGFERGG